MGRLDFDDFNGARGHAPVRLQSLWTWRPSDGPCAEPLDTGDDRFAPGEPDRLILARHHCEGTVRMMDDTPVVHQRDQPSRLRSEELVLHVAFHADRTRRAWKTGTVI